MTIRYDNMRYACGSRPNVTRVKSQRVGSRAIWTEWAYGRRGRRATCGSCTSSHKERSDCLVPTSANLHCRFPACRARVSHITARVTQNYAYGCQISRRETHVTSIKFILPAILLGNLSFVPWFRSHWSTTRMSFTDPPIAVIPRSMVWGYAYYTRRVAQGDSPYVCTFLRIQLIADPLRIRGGAADEYEYA